MPVEVPQLRKGQGLRGPEPVGCFNTGTASVILHTKTGKWIVGPDLYINDVRDAACYDVNKDKRIYKMGQDKTDIRWWVFVYKTRMPAVTKFQKLVEARNQERANDLAIIAKAKQDAKSKNPETQMKGINTLADY